MGLDLAALLESGQNADVTFKVEEETMRAHRIILTTRSPMFQGMLNSGMREGADGMVEVEGVRAPVFAALLHFIYTDSLPEV
jgi:speckle-type POZ protein